MGTGIGIVRITKWSNYRKHRLLLQKQGSEERTSTRSNERQGECMLRILFLFNTYDLQS